MRVLVLCHANTCRSPMMQAVLRDRRPDWSIESGGVAPGLEEGRPANRQAQAVLEARGLDMWGHRSRFIPSGYHNLCDAVINLTGRSLPWLSNHPRVYNLDVPNPYGKGPAAYVRCFNQIEQAADLFFAHLEDQ